MKTTTTDVRVSLSKKELTMLIESLLFAYTSDVCAEWNDRDAQNQGKLAVKLSKLTKISKLKKIYVTDSKFEDPKKVDLILQNFKIDVK